MFFSTENHLISNLYMSDLISAQVFGHCYEDLTNYVISLLTGCQDTLDVNILK